MYLRISSTHTDHEVYKDLDTLTDQNRARLLSGDPCRIFYDIISEELKAPAETVGVSWGGGDTGTSDSPPGSIVLIDRLPQDVVPVGTGMWRGRRHGCS